MNREQLYDLLCELVDAEGDRQTILRAVEAPQAIPMLLWCPLCHTRHVDEPDHEPHKTHACQSCGLLWRPALVPTAGVEFLPGCFNPGHSTIPGTNLGPGSRSRSDNDG